jgi:hypothetical protein
MEPQNAVKQCRPATKAEQLPVRCTERVRNQNPTNSESSKGLEQCWVEKRGEDDDIETVTPHPRQDAFVPAIVNGSPKALDVRLFRDYVPSFVPRAFP